MTTAPPPYPHPERPEITVLDDTPVPYGALPMAGDGVFEGNLTVRYHGTLPSAHVFRRVSVDVDALYHQEDDLETHPFYEALVEQQEPGAAHRLETIKGYIATLNAGGTLSPIVVSVDWGWTNVLDGYHRLASADAAGKTHLEAFERFHMPPHVMFDASSINRPLGTRRAPSAWPQP